MKTCLVCLFLPSALLAQGHEAGGKRIDTFMIEEPPVLDGVLGEGIRVNRSARAWQLTGDR